MGTPFISLLEPTALPWEKALPPSEQPNPSAIPRTFLDAMTVRTEVFVHEQNIPQSNEFDADQAGMDSIRTTRNLFGIPLAVRRSALGSSRYDPFFQYAGDVDLSWTIGRRGPPFHIDRPLIANRYGGANSTWSMLAGAARELRYLAEKNGLRMDYADRARLGFTAFTVAQKKRLFGAYARLMS